MLGDQIPLLGIAFQGDRHPTHRSNPVIILPKHIVFVCFAIWLVSLTGLTAGMLTFGVNKLDKATTLQCRTHDWPVKAHKIHIDWCNANGYATK